MSPEVISTFTRRVWSITSNTAIETSLPTEATTAIEIVLIGAIAGILAGLSVGAVTAAGLLCDFSKATNQHCTGPAGVFESDKQ